MKKPRISAIAAISSTNRALGRNNELLWHLPEDLKRFKELTKGHPIIMGRKTHDSILQYLGKPLPGRTSIVLTRTGAIDHPGVLSANSIEAALEIARSVDSEEVFIGGGTAIYELALPYTNRLYLTLVDDEPAADSYFPEYKAMFTELVSQEMIEHKPKFSFVILDKPAV